MLDGSRQSAVRARARSSIQRPGLQQMRDTLVHERLGVPTSDQGGSLVSLDSVTKHFDRHQQRQPDLIALQDVSVTVHRGEFIVIVGASGCGKSTLLNLVAGLLHPTRGSVARSSDVDRAGGIGMVFQDPVLLPWRSVLMNVMLPAEVLGLPAKAGRANAWDLLGLVGLRGFEDAYPYQLSGGMQQRVSLCRALLTDPPLLLMDEPFGALDAITRERMNLELQRIWLDTGKTVMLVTHSIDEAVFLSDRLVVMTPRPGRVAAILPNDLPRPRSLATFRDPTFIDLSTTLRNSIIADDTDIEPAGSSGRGAAMAS
jgi:NitT/TauT family transport system ATP-binding protein